jgi:hypothetical protein
LGCSRNGRSFATIALLERKQPVTVVSSRLEHAGVSITLDIAVTP